MPDELEIIIDENGDIKCVFYDELMPFLEALGGDMTIQRASHVEPDNKGEWWVDMTPVGGEASIGPFTERQAALDHEVDLLKANHGY